jgi:hypothetical protein
VIEVGWLLAVLMLLAVFCTGYVTGAWVQQALIRETLRRMAGRGRYGPPPAE